MNRIDKLKLTAEEYCENYNIEKTVEYIEKYCKEDANELMRQANMLLDQTFIFQDKWDMEPCNIPYTMALDTWVESPNGDEEWVFMLNRHEFLFKLWYAWVLTKEEKYVEKLRWYMFDWMDKNPITEKGTDATRTIDTGIRCMNWCSLILPMYGYGKLSDEEVIRLLESMGEQFVNLRKRYIPKYSLSNWGVLQTTAMCASYIWYRDFLPNEIEDWAWDELATQLDLQILEDGAHWEQSAMYHVEVLNTCTKLLIHLKNAELIDVELSDKMIDAMTEVEKWGNSKEAKATPGKGILRDEQGWLTSAIRVLNRHVLYTADPTWKQLPQCDSDVTDVKDVMVRATIMLDGSGIYRYAAGDELDMDSVCMLGAYGIDKFKEVEAKMPKHLFWECKDGGNIFFRSKWGEDADFTWVKNSTLGSGHGHADQTHLNLTHKGKAFLVDSGRFTYREDDNRRMELKNSAAHNVCVIDGESGGKADTSWTMESYGEVLKNYYQEKEGIHYVEMPFYGTINGGTPYITNRKLMVSNEGVWLSVQDIICQGEHEVKEYFHMDNEVKVIEEEQGFKLESGGVVLNLYTNGKPCLEDGMISKKYNELEIAPVLIKTSKMTDRMTDCTLFVADNITVEKAKVYQVGKDEEKPDEFVTAWDVLIAGKRKWTFIIFNRETIRGGKMYLCHDVPVYGKAIALCWEETGVRRIRLKV